MSKIVKDFCELFNYPDIVVEETADKTGVILNLYQFPDVEELIKFFCYGFIITSSINDDDDNYLITIKNVKRLVKYNKSV